MQISNKRMSFYNTQYLYSSENLARPGLLCEKVDLNKEGYRKQPQTFFSPASYTNLTSTGTDNQTVGFSTFMSLRHNQLPANLTKSFGGSGEAMTSDDDDINFEGRQDTDWLGQMSINHANRCYASQSLRRFSLCPNCSNGAGLIQKKHFMDLEIELGEMAPYPVSRVSISPISPRVLAIPRIPTCRL